MKSETVTLTLRENGWGVLYIEEKDGRLFETVTLTLRDNGWGVLYIEEKDGRLFETVTLTLRENGWGVLYIEEKDARLSMCLYNRDWGRLCTLKGKIGPLAYSKGRNGF